MWMINAQRADQWDHTAAIVMTIMRALGSKVEIDQINPYRTTTTHRQPFGHLKAQLDGNRTGN